MTRAMLPDPVSQPTVNIPEAARLLGCGRTSAYQTAKRTGQIGGVPVLRVGGQLRVPTAALLRVLGHDVPAVVPSATHSDARSA